MGSEGLGPVGETRANPTGPGTRAGRKGPGWECPEGQGLQGCGVPAAESGYHEAATGRFWKFVRKRKMECPLQRHLGKALPSPRCLLLVAVLRCPGLP